MATALNRPVRQRFHPRIHLVITNHPVLAAFAVLAALLVVLFLVSDTAGTPPPATVRVGAADSGSTVQLRTGDTLEVTLEGNISTGYSWEVADYDPAVVRPLDEQETVSSGTAPGSGEQVTTRFEAVGPGQTAVRMIYHRPFEKDVAPIESFVVNVVVDDQAPR